MSHSVTPLLFHVITQYQPNCLMFYTPFSSGDVCRHPKQTDTFTDDEIFKCVSGTWLERPWSLMVSNNWILLDMGVWFGYIFNNIGTSFSVSTNTCKLKLRSYGTCECMVMVICFSCKVPFGHDLQSRFNNNLTTTPILQLFHHWQDTKYISAKKIAVVQKV